MCLATEFEMSRNGFFKCKWCGGEFKFCESDITSEKDDEEIVKKDSLKTEKSYKCCNPKKIEKQMDLYAYKIKDNIFKNKVNQASVEMDNMFFSKEDYITYKEKNNQLNAISEK